mgnify:CR=1 FL=1|tara:strand:- start:7578 stop:8489 length:912 start_codon:yes stop_codon:yes gene_type:complete
MKNINKIVVGLELKEIDSYILEYLKMVGILLKPNEIQFINIHKEELPEDIAEKFPEITENIDNHYIKEMVAETTNITLLDINISYKAIQGNILVEILNASNQKNVDLLVIGRKHERQDRHIHYRTIIRKAVSNILIIPEKTCLEMKNFLVPIDFSQYSKFSIKQAITLAKAANAKIVLQNIYEVPSGYSKTGKTFSEFADIMKSHAKEKCDAFLKDIDLKDISYEIIYTLNENSSISKTIEDTITILEPDLLILGSKGKNKFSAILVGSTAESLISKREIDIPVLLTRMKTQSSTIWDAIKEF